METTYQYFVYLSNNTIPLLIVNYRRISNFFFKDRVMATRVTVLVLLFCSGIFLAAETLPLCKTCSNDSTAYYIDACNPFVNSNAPTPENWPTLHSSLLPVHRAFCHVNGKVKSDGFEFHFDPDPSHKK